MLCLMYAFVCLIAKADFKGGNSEGAGVKLYVGTLFGERQRKEEGRDV